MRDEWRVRRLLFSQSTARAAPDDDVAGLIVALVAYAYRLALALLFFIYSQGLSFPPGCMESYA